MFFFFLLYETRGIFVVFYKYIYAYKENNKVKTYKVSKSPSHASETIYGQLKVYAEHLNGKMSKRCLSVWQNDGFVLFLCCSSYRIEF